MIPMQRNFMGPELCPWSPGCPQTLSLALLEGITRTGHKEMCEAPSKWTHQRFPCRHCGLLNTNAISLS